jgi:hypothetical protein
MKTWLVALLAAVIGIGIGVGITVAEFSSAREVFATQEASEPGTETRPAGGFGRAVVVGGADYGFGIMERDVKGRHEFTIKNEGTAPITVKVGQTTCKCTVAALKNGRLAPGESTKVELEWEPKTYFEDFRQSAEIEITNDPANPILRLSIHGSIIQSVRPIPDEMKLDNVSANEPSQGEIKLFGFTNTPLEITSHSLVNPEYADRFELSIRPLTEEEIAAQPQAKSGHAVTLSVKSGLPIGTVKQTIRLETNVPTAKVVEVPVHLTVASDISIICASPGATFASDKNLLRLGKLKSGKGAKVRLLLMVKGPHRKDTQFQIESTEPAGTLTATLGKPSPIANGAAVSCPLEINIPPDASPISRLGGEQGELGKIKISTTHPIAKEVRLFVQFAIE